MKYLAPIPKQFVDQNGLPLSNGTVHVYISGDTQYANVYQNADGNELMPNPARLDSNGAWLGFVTAGIPMDYVVEDDGGNVQFSYQRVAVPSEGGGGGGGGSEVIVEQVLTDGTEIADVFIDGERTPLYAPTPLELGETSTTAYPGDMGKAAYDLADGKYSKPSGGIPKTDLASGVQTSLGKADTSVQSVKINSGTELKDSSGNVNIPLGTTSVSGAVQLEDSHSSTSTTKAATPNSVKEAYDLANTANTEAVKNVAYDSVNKKITKTVNDTTTDVVSVATLKTAMDLANVDNTSDANKPVSTAQQEALDLKLDKTGDGKDVTVTFTEAATRVNIGTGEKLSVIFGKIKKWLTDLGTAAFKDVPASGNASNTEVVLGNDSRLSAGASAVQDVTVDGVSVVNSSTKVAAVPNASSSAKGVVQLEDSHTSTSTTKAATPNSVKDAYDLANTAYSGLANKQDKPVSATEDNIATFNGSKSTKDSGKAFLPSTSTWDGTSENVVPTAKAVQVQLDGKLTDSPRVSQRAPTADEKTGGMTDAYYKVSYDTDKTVFMDVTDNRSGLWARRSNSIGDWLVWMDNNGDGHLNGTSTKAQGYESGGGIDLALQGKQATCMFRVETPEWNDLVESGFYEVRGSSPAGTNHSPEGGLIKCIVVKAVNASNQTGVSQIAMGDYVYTRFKPSNSSTWSDWKVLTYSNKFAAADSGKMVGIDANGLLANTGVRTSEALKAVNYNRVHVEAMRGIGGSGISSYYNVGLYRYDGGNSILVPTQTGTLNVGELVGGAEAIVKYSPQDWTPTSYNCEDFLIVTAGVGNQKLYDALQLGELLSDTSCRRFTLRLANISDKDWHIMICHTFGNGHEGLQIPEINAYNSEKYSGNFTPIINQLVRAEKYYDVLIRPDKCVKVDIMISSMVYNSTSGLMAIIDTDEPYDPA